jgi:hypothetical protein
MTCASSTVRQRPSDQKQTPYFSEGSRPSVFNKNGMAQKQQAEPALAIRRDTTSHPGGCVPAWVHVAGAVGLLVRRKLRESRGVIVAPRWRWHLFHLRSCSRTARHWRPIWSIGVYRSHARFWHDAAPDTRLGRARVGLIWSRSPRRRQS